MEINYNSFINKVEDRILMNKETRNNVTYMTFDLLKNAGVIVYMLEEVHIT